MELSYFWLGFHSRARPYHFGDLCRGLTTSMGQELPSHAPHGIDLEWDHLGAYYQIPQPLSCFPGNPSREGWITQRAMPQDWYAP
jgi:hypothetical protein